MDAEKNSENISQSAKRLLGSTPLPPKPTISSSRSQGSTTSSQRIDNDNTPTIPKINIGPPITHTPPRMIQNPRSPREMVPIEGREGPPITPNYLENNKVMSERSTKISNTGGNIRSPVKEKSYTPTDNSTFNGSNSGQRRQATPARIQPARQTRQATTTRSPYTSPAYIPSDMRYSETRYAETRHPDIRPAPSSRVNQTMNFPMYSQMQSENQIVRTPNGEFVVPNFNLMTSTDIERYRNSYVTKFSQMNEDWKHLGITFDLPRPGENITNIAVRYLETEKHLSTKTGTDFWFIILCAGWGFIQYMACEYGLPAEGYVDSQIRMYKMYQSQLIRMGTASGFGTEWSPWMQVTVTSCANLALLVLLSKLGGPGAKNCAPMLMREISSVITGSKDVETSSEGTPKPSAGGLASIVGNMMGGEGGSSADGFINMLSGKGGGGGGLMDMVTGLLGGGKKKPRSKKEKNKSKNARRQQPDIDI
jgi:hypothetical protein